MTLAMDGVRTQRPNRLPLVLMVASPLSPVIAAAAEPVLPTGPSMEASGFAMMMLKLAIVLALIVGGGWLVKRLRRGQRPGNSTLEVLDVLPVGPKERILLVRAGDIQLLVGSAPGCISTLHCLEQPLSFAEHTRLQIEEQAA